MSEESEAKAIVLPPVSQNDSDLDRIDRLSQAPAQVVKLETVRSMMDRVLQEDREKRAHERDMQNDRLQLQTARLEAVKPLVTAAGYTFLGLLGVIVVGAVIAVAMGHGEDVKRLLVDVAVPMIGGVGTVLAVQAGVKKFGGDV